MECREILSNDGNLEEDMKYGNQMTSQRHDYHNFYTTHRWHSFMVKAAEVLSCISESEARLHKVRLYTPAQVSGQY